jgi:hypothetical protein
MRTSASRGVPRPERFPPELWPLCRTANPVPFAECNESQLYQAAEWTSLVVRLFTVPRATLLVQLATTKVLKKCSRIAHARHSELARA